MGKLTSCTWKKRCQNHNYVREELIARYQVKEKTQLFEEKMFLLLFGLPLPNQAVMVISIT